MYIVVLGILFATLALIWGVRKHMMDWIRDPGQQGPAFTLTQLRDLHRSGSMTDEEFERAKNQLIASAKGVSSKADVEKRGST